MGYFFQISIWDGSDVVVKATLLTQKEFARLWSFHEKVSNRNALMEYAEGETADTWEAYTDMKLYLSESMALGSALRMRHKMLARAKRARRADVNGKRRKKIQYGVIGRRQLSLERKHQ